MPARMEEQLKKLIKRKFEVSFMSKTTNRTGTLNAKLRRYVERKN